MGKKYNLYEITVGDDHIIEIATDPRWTIRKDDIYFNTYTELVLIEYLNIAGEMVNTKAYCQGLEYINISKEK